MITNKIPNMVIPYHVVEDIDAHATTIQGMLVNLKYEIHTKVLQSIEIEHFLPHCLAFRNKINTIMGVEAHKGPLFYCVFPQMLSLVLHVVWEQINQDANKHDEVNNEETVANFDTRLPRIYCSPCYC